MLPKLMCRALQLGLRHPSMKNLEDLYENIFKQYAMSLEQENFNSDKVRFLAGHLYVSCGYRTRKKVGEPYNCRDCLKLQTKVPQKRKDFSEASGRRTAK